MFCAGSKILAKNLDSKYLGEKTHKDALANGNIFWQIQDAEKGIYPSP